MLRLFTAMAAMLLASGSAAEVTLKRDYHDRDARGIHEDGERKGTIRRDYYDRDAWGVYRDGRRQGTLKRGYYDRDGYRYDWRSDD